LPAIAPIFHLSDIMLHAVRAEKKSSRLLFLMEY